MKAAPVARFVDVLKVYRQGLWPRRQIAALGSVSVEVPAGSVFGLVGPNRAGKTTLVKILLSLTRATSGVAERLGHSVACRRTLAAVGYVHESQAFSAYWSALSLLDFYGALGKLTTLERQVRVPELLERVGLDDRANEPIGNFSKGMLQRLALAQALLNDPELLVLDEPAEGLDLTARRMFHDVINERKRRGLSVLLVSHSLADVERCCDHVAVLRDGQIVYSGDLASLPTASATSDRPLEEVLAPLYEGACA
ncbi:MAG: ABC transporter ATP-binding protein [Planctomycetes bacterium]|nr:ABC transporter ATP-binding protein [Planctomycetota bacterium]